MSPDKLNSYPKERLAEMAKRKGIRGWNTMRKQQLVRALTSDSKPQRKRLSSTNGAMRKPRVSRSRSRNHSKTLTARRTNSSRILARTIPEILPNGYEKDRIIVMVRDPYWLHAYWEITCGSISRAHAALGQEWHASRPILRVIDVSSDETTSSSERHVRDIEIHGGVRNWYIDVQDPPRSFRIDVGYLTPRGKFFGIARSNVVKTPRAGVSEAVDDKWSDVPEDFRRIYAMSGGLDPASNHELKEFVEEQLGGRAGSLVSSTFGSGAVGHQKKRGFRFQIEAELIIYGATQPGSRVTLQGEPVPLRSDGTFSMRFNLPDNRQIIPAVARSSDGVEERTIVLAVERNTKELEPMIHDGYE